MRLRLTQIHDLLAIAESGSIRSAARSRGVSQPAMTKSVRQLERELRTQLLHRTSRGAVPTRTGRAFLARARVIRAELRKAEEDLAQLRGEGGGAVSIGVSPTLSVLLIPEALRSLQQRRPLSSIHVVEGVWSSLQPLVREERLDLAIVLRTPDARLDPALRFRPLYRAQMVVAGRRGHPLAGARALRELASAYWLMFGPSGETSLLTQYFAAAQLPPPAVIVQCESYAAALALMTRTDTLGLIMPQLLAEPYTHGFLQQLKVGQPPPPEVAVGTLSRADAPLAPAASAMARALTAAARRFAGTQTGP